MSITIRETGRVIASFIDDLKLCAPFYWQRAFRPPVPNGRYIPPGLYVNAEQGPGKPLLYRLPPPYHPLEAVYSYRGGLPLEQPGSSPTDWCDGMRTISEWRAKPWRDRMADVAVQRFVTPETARLVCHLLTPLHVPVDSSAMSASTNKVLLCAQLRLWVALGFTEGAMRAANEAACERGLPFRDDFWTADVFGEIEL